MAIIDGKVPPPPPPSVGPRQLVVKLRDTNLASFLKGAQKLLATRDIRPSAKPLLREEDRLSPPASKVLAPYFALDLPADADPDAIAEELTKRDEIETAYVAGRPCPPPVNPGDDPRSNDQGYLDAAPGGIDARWGWGQADGSGVGFVDLERGWTLDHEDLADAGITLISGDNQDFPGHGTAVLGEVVARDNAIGNIGIAPQATARVVSQWRTTTTYNTAAAILSAADNMQSGDVLLLEAQTTIGSSSFLPVEVESAAFDAIRYAVDQGIVVVEAAGNGSNDLDRYRDSAGKTMLDRASPDFKDSGAIMVGAASSATPHQRLNFSNFGSRIDCFAWGQNIDTCGDGWMGNQTNVYMTGFGGTSGASPIVTGAALLLQSWFVRVDSKAALPQVIRSILSDEMTNTGSASPATDRIGVMPNLRAIIEGQQRRRQLKNAGRYASFVFILTGIIDDSPGIIWVPGKGPVPVDPEWGKTPVSRAQKDMLVAMLIAELSEKMGDGEERQRIAGEAVRAMERSVAAIGQELLHQ